MLPKFPGGPQHFSPHSDYASFQSFYSEKICHVWVLACSPKLEVVWESSHLA